MGKRWDTIQPFPFTTDNRQAFVTAQKDWRVAGQLYFLTTKMYKNEKEASNKKAGIAQANHIATEAGRSKNATRR
jgi:hypothetical protein